MDIDLIGVMTTQSHSSVHTIILNKEIRVIISCSYLISYEKNYHSFNIYDGNFKILIINMFFKLII